MAGTENDGKLKDYADGWITERTGTDVPGFLKLVYIVVVVGCISYAILFMNGEVDHETRGALVRQFNAATGDANTFMYGVAGITSVFALVLWLFAFSKPHD